MIQLSNPILFLTGLWVALYRDHMGIVRISILCSLLHELGHVMVWVFLKRSMPELVLSPIGIGLSIYDAHFSSRQELVLAAAGPLVNFVLAIISWGILSYHASYWGYFFMGANLLISLFNLLPVGCLDGKRIWKNLLNK